MMADVVTDAGLPAAVKLTELAVGVLKGLSLEGDRLMRQHICTQRPVWQWGKQNEQIKLPAKLLNHFSWSNKSDINSGGANGSGKGGVGAGGGSGASGSGCR